MMICTSKYIVERVVEHRYNSEKQLELLVLWYGTKEPEWIKHSKDMNNYIIVLTYLDAHGMKSLIPLAQKRQLEEEKKKTLTKRVRFVENKTGVNTPTAVNTSEVPSEAARQ